MEEKMQRHMLDPPLPYLSNPLYRRRPAPLLEYAFGAQGDIWMLGQWLGKPEAEKFNKEAAFIDYYMKNSQQEPSQQQHYNQNLIYDSVKQIIFCVQRKIKPHFLYTEFVA